jgi:SecD/SecF fusion protein
LVALFHDVLFVLGIFSIFNGILPFSLEIDQAFIAAILTVVGYSVNDSVVVFDRIREYVGEHKRWDRKTTYNAAINSTLARTMNTSFTTLLTIAVMFVFGGDVIRGFMFALLVGIGIGTYSSVFVATNIVFDTLKRQDKAVVEDDSKIYKGGKKKEKILEE